MQVADHFAPHRAVVEALRLVTELGRHHGCELAGGLFGGEAEDLLGTTAPNEDPAIEIGAYDCDG